jgi:hypothetical protein
MVLEQLVNKVKSGSYTLSVKVEFINLASPLFQAQIQDVHLSLEEAYHRECVRTDKKEQLPDNLPTIFHS